MAEIHYTVDVKFIIFLFLEPCQPGSWSRTGYAPCDLCPLNFYQDESNAMECKECATDSITANAGAQSVTECVALTGEWY